jgi:alpha-1,6-mannosyltransferase
MNDELRTHLRRDGRPLKVVDVAEFYAEEGGGVRTYIHQKLAAAKKFGVDVAIIAPGPEDREEVRDGGRILWVKGPPMPLDPRYYILWNERAVHRLLDREAPDIVEGSSPWSGGWFAARWRGPVAARARKTFIFHQDPVAVYPQTFFGHALGAERVDRLFQPYWFYLQRLSGHFDATIVAGDWLAERLRAFGVHNPVPVPFGIDKARFSPSHRDPALKRDWLRRCGIPDEVHRDATLWVAISRFHPEKRIGTMLEAFEAASEHHPMGLVLIGDGPLRKWVERRAARVKGVVLTGFLKDRALVARTLASADAFLHGSAAETYGLVVAEAICSGLPLVVPSRGGAADLARDAYAETYQAGDPESCAAAMRALLARPRDLMARALSEAASHAIGTMDDHFERLFAYYATL